MMQLLAVCVRYCSLAFGEGFVCMDVIEAKYLANRSGPVDLPKCIPKVMYPK